MQRVLIAVTVLLVAALAASVGWALSERGARLAAESENSRLVGRGDGLAGQLAATRGKLDAAEKERADLKSSVAALEKWRNGAEGRLASFERRRREGRPEARPEVGRIMEVVNAMMPAAAGNAERFQVEGEDGRKFNVSMLGSARLGEDLARELGIDEKKRARVNELIRAENQRYIRERVLPRAGGGAGGVRVVRGGGAAVDDSWPDFVNGKLKPIIGDDAAAKFLEKFPRRSRGNMITRMGGGGEDGAPQRVMIRLKDLGNGGTAPAPEKPKEQF
jgi:hypothetical protein